MAVDYKSFSPTGPATEGPISADRRWWSLDNPDVPGAITGIINFLNEHQGARITQNLMSARLYGNLSVMGLNGLTYSKIASVQNALKDRISYNVCQSAVDTITSKIAKNKPRPLFLTSGGDYKIQRRAKKLSKFTDGIFYENNAYVMGPAAFRDGAIWGSGIIHVFTEHGRVKWERVIPTEIQVDEVEGFYGKPRQLHRVKNVDRQVLADLYPKKRAAIMRAQRASSDSLGGYENISDVVAVRESWHLASGPDAGDGKHVITIAEDLLFQEEWKRDHFPFAIFHWSKRLFGFWGQGLIEQIQNIQVEINKILWLIQRSMHLAGTFKIAVENTSKIAKTYFNNDIGTIIPYTDKPPLYLVPPIVQPETYAHLETLKRQAFEQAGISQLSAAAKKPDGLDSGKALREFNDIESDRFMTVGQAYEQFFLDLARLSIEEGKAIFAENKKFSVTVPGRKFVETIDWKDIDLKEDQYIMKFYPVSSLPNDPAGRLQTVQEYAQAGFISQRTAQRLLDFPDLEQVESLATAQENYLHELFERIVDADSIEEAQEAYTAPEPFDDLQLAQELALEYYAQGKSNGLEEGKLDLLRQFIDQINMLNAKAAMPDPGMVPPQGPAPAGPGGAPAVPTAPPVSDLLPNVAA